jgi:hypothetical protein
MKMVLPILPKKILCKTTFQLTNYINSIQLAYACGLYIYRDSNQNEVDLYGKPTKASGLKYFQK